MAACIEALIRSHVGRNHRTRSNSESIRAQAAVDGRRRHACTCRCTLTRTSPPAYHVSVVSWSPAVTLTVALTPERAVAV
jgi:hypothetical protein